MKYKKNLVYSNVLVTGGAGFIGSHLVDELIRKGYRVRILDNLDSQVHDAAKPPAYLNQKAEFIRGDVTKRSDWKKALSGIDAVFHFAASVGVGQSMYKIAHYVKVNSYGTALLLDILANEKHRVQKIISTASMTSYGEGTYQCATHGIVRPPLRESVHQQQWEPVCPVCSRDVVPVPTPENATLNGNSIYAITKNNQEDLVMVFGRAYDMPVVSLRFFNVYGTRQSLSNPYTGVAAIFLSRVKNGKQPLVNEDGLQSRDFVYVSDVVRACILSLETGAANNQIFNVGSGRATTVKQLAETIIELTGSSVKPSITKKFRKLDIRHCTADISHIQNVLGWKSQVSLAHGLRELIAWGEQERADDRVEQAVNELTSRGLQ